MTTTDGEAGGHAFPCAIHEGMTLRDYFAASIAGHCVPIIMSASASGGIPAADATKLIADMAYELADAMLEARKR
jgi:hypothetical protein